MSPFSGGERHSAAGREPPLASAAAGRGMVRRKVGKLLSPVLTAMMFVPGLQKLIPAAALGNLEGLKASSVVYNSWIETKGHKGLEGVDEN